MKHSTTHLTRLLASLLLLGILALAASPSAQARFLTPDTWDPWLQGVDINRYAYGGNDPINNSDPNGHQVPNEYNYYDSDQDGIDDLIDNHPGIPDNAIIDINPMDDLAKGISGGGAPRGLAKTLEKALKGQTPPASSGPRVASRGAGKAVNGGVGYKTFDALKQALGSPGPGKVWHHVVEQCQGKCTRSAFPAEVIHNTKNVAAVPDKVNQRLADLYASKPRYAQGMTVRDWLKTKPYKEQYQFGIERLKEEMEKYDKEAAIKP